MSRPHPLETTLGRRFKDKTLLRAALTHPSVSGGNASTATYERLEFLGDRVLGLAVADMLVRRYPDEREGALARRHVALVRAEALTEVARKIDLARHLTLSRGELESGGADNPQLLADACEALIGALYMDAGFTEATRFIQDHWTPLMESHADPPKDAKTALQEWVQARGLALPVYEIVGRSGPDHDPVFSVAVCIEGRPPVVAEGSSRRAGEQRAAAAMMKSLEP